jgi:RND family efflux transporter MFP subunit
MISALSHKYQSLSEGTMMNKTALETENQPARKWLCFFTAVAILAGVVAYLLAAENSIDISRVKEAPPLQVVSVETAIVGAKTVEVSTYTEIKPRWSAELKAAVSGEVIDVMVGAMIGERVAKGTALICIEDSRYVANLFAAELFLEEAKLALRKAMVKTAVARKEYEYTGAKPLNDLALHLPELQIAQNQVQSAEARVVVAKKDLNDTIVSAPFSGFVTDRFVSPRQSVSVGDSLITLADDRVFELIVELGNQDWSLVEQPVVGLKARVLNQKGGLIGLATVRQGGGFLDQKTRQYKIFLEIKATASQPVLAGEFVQVVLPGMTVANALDIPSSAITQNGYFWYVDDDSRLQRQSPQVLFRQQLRTVIEAPDGFSHWRVAVTPLASFLPGQKVQTLEMEN